MILPNDTNAIRSIPQWIDNYKYPLIVSGPCSAESENQVMLAAHALKNIDQVRVFRAGIWKPRSRPQSFQGNGEKALKWMQRVKAETGLLTATEVASPQHVEMCLNYGIDILWIGARTSVNPFYVQEITQVLKGTDIPIMIKNPVNPDLDLWVGAIERFLEAGLTKIIAIHRGFNTYEKTPYRNHPIWNIPLELKRLFPELPILCDPSHIAGKREFLKALSQKAFDLGMCGLMIESHPEPDKAISDPEQQITPRALEQMLSELIFRKEQGDFDFQKHLETVRNDIDNIDGELLNLLKKRFELVQEIGKQKKKQNITIYQVKRWHTILNERSALSEKLGIDKDFIVQLLRLVHDESIRLQHLIMNKEKK